MPPPSICRPRSGRTAADDQRDRRINPEEGRYRDAEGGRAEPQFGLHQRRRDSDRAAVDIVEENRRAEQQDEASIATRVVAVPAADSAMSIPREHQSASATGLSRIPRASRRSAGRTLGRRRSPGRRRRPDVADIAASRPGDIGHPDQRREAGPLCASGGRYCPRPPDPHRPAEHALHVIGDILQSAPPPVSTTGRPTGPVKPRAFNAASISAVNSSTRWRMTIIHCARVRRVGSAPSSAPLCVASMIS